MRCWTNTTAATSQCVIQVRLQKKGVEFAIRMQGCLRECKADLQQGLQREPEPLVAQAASFC